MDCTPPGSSVHGLLQARILKWVAMASSNLEILKYILYQDKENSQSKELKGVDNYFVAEKIQKLNRLFNIDLTWKKFW